MHKVLFAYVDLLVQTVRSGEHIFRVDDGSGAQHVALPEKNRRPRPVFHVCVLSEYHVRLNKSVY
ncbi:hypothetical protein DPMN_047063 [Dreissena polymorpha]|uniref:Uncharacterized protein n=1 Tax=Dreissena polymorpha TaxID=45954 RepID=A0A9D4D810_DREPO|nr:hypothetical protein DPMN_047063 [Dreissena polymorpha]